jgi:adenosylcobinamide kinase/adenosylcobinamide-phosphate guanylyltransferase
MAKEVILIGGGARSGKSELALHLARRRGRRRIFVATAEPRDGEMRDRIARHRAERGPDFETLEEPLEIAAVLARIEADVVVLDCLTLWLSNMLCRGDAPSDIARSVDALIEVLARRAYDALVVTNEVGMGLVPETPLGRAFRDIAGVAHQRMSRLAGEVYFGALGTMLRIKPAPLAVVQTADGDDHTAPGDGSSV